MSQFLVLSRPLSSTQSSHSTYSFSQTDEPALVAAARQVLDIDVNEAVFVVTPHTGEPFEVHFDRHPLDANQTCQLIDDCARSFAAIAFFYGDAVDLDRATDLAHFKEIVRRQFAGTPTELYAAWSA